MEITANVAAGETNPPCKTGYRKIGHDCQKMDQPSQTLTPGADWPCRDGYQRMGNYCRKIFVPANADVKGSQWYCKAGYTRQANACIKLSSVKNSIQ
jgi:hypothetical protein